MIRTYSELITLPTFSERYRYLSLKGKVGEDTFGSKRYLNQAFYTSKEWMRFRDHIIARDLGCDLGCEDRQLFKFITVHHLNPISIEDIISGSPRLIDPENAICVSDMTHKAIHYGDESLLPAEPTLRRPNDTCPWRR